MKGSWITADEVAARLKANVKPCARQLATPPWAELIIAKSSVLWSSRNVFSLNASRMMGSEGRLDGARCSLEHTKAHIRLHTPSSHRPVCRVESSPC